tara:strand:+ start:3848 stop:4219 length:372 start_codon:yes stop_codon:yes gene_type:complete
MTLITKITFPGIVHGLNGSHGLIREHYRTAKKKKIKYKQMIMDQTSNKHTGKVIIEYTGYKSRFMDWDNFAASFKHIGDSLVAAGVITDDKPSIIVQFIPKQIKCKMVDQRVEVTITDYNLEN